MLTVELRFKENGREVSIDQLADEFATKLASVLKEQLIAKKNERLPPSHELESQGKIHPTPDDEGKELAPMAVGIDEAAKLRLAYGRRQAALALGISTRSIDYLIAQGTLKAKKIGGRVLIPVQELKRLVAVR